MSCSIFPESWLLASQQPANIRATTTSWYQPRAQAYLAIVKQPFFGKTKLMTLAPPVGTFYG